MSVTYAEQPGQLQPPFLRVVHSRPALVPPLDTIESLGGGQGELPLTWASHGRGRRPDGLAHYPAIRLNPSAGRPEPYVAQVSTLLADVLAGTRPATQLARWATLEVQQRLARRAALRHPDRGGPAHRTRVSSISTMVVSATAVQTAVVFFIGARAHAAAVRMEYRHGRWQVTDVQSPA